MSHYLFHTINLENSSIDGHIKDINIKVHDNEIHTLVIKDSSEQALFIEALNHMHHSSGEVFFQGQKITNDRHDTSLLENPPFSILHEVPPVLNNLTVAENIHLKSLPKYKFLGLINWRKVRKDCRNVLNDLKLDYPLNHKLREFSDEDKKFIYVAQVFLANPKLIIMHEPIEGLSAKNASKMYEIIQQFKEDGGSVLYITKQWEEALKISDRISILTNGKITDEMLAKDAKVDPQQFIKKIEGYHYKVDSYSRDDHESLLNTVFKAAEFLTSEYELKDVLLLLVKEVCRIMHADGCSIQLIDEDSWNIIDQFEYQQRHSIYAELTKETMKHVAENNEIFYINEKDKEFNMFFEKNNHVKTYICVPVFIRSQVTGVIGIFYEHLYVYSKEESQYLSALAKHAALAIEDTRLMGRSTLLQESHHRIKNNLQSIISLITLQKNIYSKNQDKSIDELLDNVIQRIKSIAAVHNILSSDQFGRSIINLKDIISSVIHISKINTDIDITVELDDIFIPYNKATSIALIINELVINSQKHAFKEGQSGVIRVKTVKYEEYVLISVHDNGVGITDEHKIEKSKNIGLNILESIIINEFNGEMSMDNNNGLETTIQIPSNRLFVSNMI
ncbi:sugar ABC transporter ATPase [Gracilibacillus halophilus YIM-C55.5]|uniref:histidine kinase n=1 Tax=Gracilibacillus halophilus YIM-C55.5 TaxID=1308866 RepID=N4W9C2_9BACI|nr:histidine kinase dimerization/phosphoacceptor domain -containing protein [Gracilibacillus halophilus]ENH96883.1 sugar ABC transporter ATPase [Gracilibacillus halophilus YIM-C55.5]